MSGLGLRITLAEVRLLAQAADAIERLKADAAEFAEEMAERTGVAEFLDVGGLAFDVEPERALAYFRGKGLRPSFSYADMIGAVNDQAFTVAKMMDVDLLGQVRDSLTAALAEGQQFREWKATIQPTLESAGWWGTRSMVDPLTGRTVQAQLGSAWRLETIFRTNMQTAYAAQAWTEIEAQADIAPYLIYDAVDDLRTREAHRRWDRTTLPVDSPWWRTHYPPNGWNCRCGVIQVSEDELRELGIRPTAPPDDGAYKWTNPRTGQVIKVPDGIDPGFDRNPGQDVGAGLRRVLVEKVQVLPPPARKAVTKAPVPDFDPKTSAGRWHTESWTGTPDWLAKKVKAEKFVNAAARSKNGAFARGGQLIDMDGEARGTANAQAVWRHEFGHILDWRAARAAGLSDRYISQSKPFQDAMRDDSQRLVRTAPHSTGMMLKRTESDQVYDRVAERVNDTPEDQREALLRDMAKAARVDFDELYRLLNQSTPVIAKSTIGDPLTSSAGAYRIGRIIEAIRIGDGEGFVRWATMKDRAEEATDALDLASWSYVVSQAWRKDGSLLTFSDLIGAVTKNTACDFAAGYAGHSASYYAKRPGYGYGTEAFANLTSLAGHPNPLWWELTQRFVPRSAAVFKTLIGTL